MAFTSSHSLLIDIMYMHDFLQDHYSQFQAIILYTLISICSYWMVVPDEESQSPFL